MVVPVGTVQPVLPRSGQWLPVLLLCLSVSAVALAQESYGVKEIPLTGSSDSYGTPGSPYSLKTADPVSAASGAYSFDLPLLSLGGPMGLHFGLVYDQAIVNLKTNPFGGGFSSGCFWWTPYANGAGGGQGDTAFFPIYEDGLNVAFSKPSTASTTWTLYDSTASYPDIASPVRYQLKESANYLYLLDPIRERVYVFSRTPCQFDYPVWKALHHVLDRNGNRLTYTYATGGDGRNCRVIQIADGLGRELNFTYTNIPAPSGTPRLTGVDDGKGRNIALTYDELAVDQNGSIVLRGVTDPLNQSFGFQYQYLTGPVDFPVPFRGLVASVTYPMGNKPVTNTYGFHSVISGGKKFFNSRVDQQTDALGNTTTLGYAADGYATTVTRPDGAARDFQHFSAFSPPQGLTDETDRAAAYAKNALNQTTQVTDRMGGGTSFTYQAETGKLAGVTNAKNQKVTNTYTPQDQTFTNPANGETVTFTFHNLTRVDYPDGTSEQITYDERGNALTRTDAAGKVWANTYNGLGQVLTAANPAGGTIANSYNADGTLASSEDSDTEATTYGYDVHKRLVTITAPGGRTTAIAYDADDRVASLTDENGHSYTYVYDANGNMTRVTDPDGNTTQYAYDLMDRLAGVTDRLNMQGSLAYNSRGRLSQATDPTGVAAGFGYDPRGWPNSRTLGGQAWQTGYDAEGVASRETLPGGQAGVQTTDQLGLTATVTDPLNRTTSLERDGVNRVVGVTDPLDRTTQFDYDTLGMLTGITLPAVGQAAFAYNDLGLPTGITDLNGRSWPFTYSATGLLRSSSDPLAQTTTYAYDASGRMQTATYADGGTQTFSYDAVGNVTGRAYSAGPSLNFTYDALDRPTATTGSTLTYDAEGRVLATGDGVATFIAAFDEAGRLKTLDYGGGLAVTYTYDASGSLVQVGDNLANQVGFSYDSNRWLIRITRSNGISTAFTQDAAGQTTRIQDEGLLDQQFEIDAVGGVTRTTVAGSAALDPTAAVAGGQIDLAYDAASQVGGAGYAYDQRGRLTAAPGRTYAWDGASRLTGSGDVAFAYNGFDELIGRTEGGETTLYHYHYGVGLAPVLAESAGGVMSRYYVWTPGGDLLYAIDSARGGAASFYHFDRAGSTLALSDGAGAATDRYAYDPYGRLLAHVGESTQPFTFAGRGGVRQDGVGGSLYQMRARYYDAGTGRFLSRDPAWPNGQVLALNPYSYANSNPVSYVDVSGEASGALNPVAVEADAAWESLRVAFMNDKPQLYRFGDKVMQFTRMTSKETGELTIGVITDRLDPKSRAYTIDQATGKILTDTRWAKRTQGLMKGRAHSLLGKNLLCRLRMMAAFNIVGEAASAALFYAVSKNAEHSATLLRELGRKTDAMNKRNVEAQGARAQREVDAWWVGGGKAATDRFVREREERKAGRINRVNQRKLALLIGNREIPEKEKWKIMQMVSKGIYGEYDLCDCPE